MHRFRPLVIVLVVALVAWSAYWVLVSQMVRRGIDDWMAQQRARGGEVRTAGLSVGGFPLAFETDAREVDLLHPDGAVLRLASLTARAPSWAPTEIDVRLDRGIHLVLPVQVGASSAPVTVVAAGGDGDLGLSLGGDLRTARLGLSDIAIEGAPAGRITAAAAEIRAIQPAAQPAGASLGVTAQARTVTAAAMPLPRLGPSIDSALIELALTGPVPRAAQVPELTAWRDAGGTVRVERLALVWGPLAVEATGTLALDQALQPRGRLDAQVRGFTDALQALAAAGTVTSAQAGFIGLALNVMAGPPGADGIATLRAPLAIDNGIVSLAGFPLGAMPRIVWASGT